MRIYKLLPETTIHPPVSTPLQEARVLLLLLLPAVADRRMEEDRLPVEDFRSEEVSLRREAAVSHLVDLPLLEAHREEDHHLEEGRQEEDSHHSEEGRQAEDSHHSAGDHLVRRLLRLPFPVHPRALLEVLLGAGHRGVLRRATPRTLHNLRNFHAVLTLKRSSVRTSSLLGTGSLLPPSTISPTSKN